MQQLISEEITIITSNDGTWQKEKISLGQEKWYSPWQWRRMYEEKMSPDKREAMQNLRRADEKIRRFADDLRTLIDLIPKDPTKLADIALVLGEISQKLTQIQNTGKSIKDTRKRRLADFYGRFSIDIPKHIRTKASNQSNEKVVTAGLISNFIQMLGSKIFELTDPEIREMKRVVSHLINRTRNMSKSIDKHLADMNRSRKTGNIAEYLESLKQIGEEQAVFEDEYLTVYDAYLKEPYEQALAATSEKEEQQPEKVVISPEGEFEVVDAPPNEEEIREEEEMAKVREMPIFQDTPLTEPDWKGIAPGTINEEQRQRMLNMLDETEKGKPSSEIKFMEPRFVDETSNKSVNTRRIDSEKTPIYDPELSALRKRMPPPLPIPQYVETPGMEEKQYGLPIVTPPQPIPPTVDDPELNAPRTAPMSSPLQPKPTVPTQKSPQFPGGIGGDAPASSEMNIPVSWETDTKKPWDPKATKPSVYAEIKHMLNNIANERFLAKLDKIAETENKYIVAAFMARYSEQLEDVNPIASAKLLQAAQSIMDD